MDVSPFRQFANWTFRPLVLGFWANYGYGTIEKLTLTAAYRRINVSFMKISYSHGARN